MSMETETTLSDLTKRIRAFAQARDWGQFHAPKNLAMALASEVGELMEHFLWVDTGESLALCENPDKQALVAEELADVLIYALRFADVAGLDPAAVVLDKLAINEEKYPVEKAKGSSAKYDQL